MGPAKGVQSMNPQKDMDPWEWVLQGPACSIQYKVCPHTWTSEDTCERRCGGKGEGNILDRVGDWMGINKRMLVTTVRIVILEARP